MFRSFPFGAAVLVLLVSLVACSELSTQGEEPSIVSFAQEVVEDGVRLWWEVESLGDGELTLSPGPNGEDTLNAAAVTANGLGDVVVQPGEETTYVLSAENEWGRDQRSLTVDVETLAPTIVAFDWETIDDGFRLSWLVRGLDDGILTLSPGPEDEGEVDVTARTRDGSGSIEIRPEETTTYTIRAENEHGFGERALTVTVPAGGPVLASFDWQRVEDGARLAWEVQGLDGGTLVLQPGTGGQEREDVTAATEAGVGDVLVQPEETTTYLLVAENAAGRDERSTTVTVEGDGTGPAIERFEVEPAEANDGVEVDATFSWSVADAESLRLYGPGLSSGGEDVTGTSSFSLRATAGEDYELEAVNDGGTSRATVRVMARGTPAVSFLVAGQSNAQGVNLKGEQATAFISADAGVRMLGNDYVWKGAYEPLDDCTDQVDDVSHDPGGGTCEDMGNSGVSMGVSLGNRVSDATGGRVFLIPAALGGSGASEWLPRSDPYDRSTLYGSANHRGRLAGWERGAPLGYSSGGARYGAVVWYQGETDTRSVSNTNSYVSKTDEILNAFQADRGAPVLFVQLSRREEEPRNRLYQRVREFQRAMASGARAADGSTSGIAEAERFLVVTHDLPLVDEGNGDDKHLTAGAQVELGRRVALAYREHLLGEGIDGTGPRLVGVEVDGSIIRVHVDRAVDPPKTNGADAYSGYFNVYDGGDPAEIETIELEDASTIRIALKRTPSGGVEVAYMPPPGEHRSVVADVVRSAACGEPMPAYGLCLPMPAFGMAPTGDLEGLRFQVADDE